MGFGAGGAGERTKEESSRAGGRSWWGRGRRKAEEQMSSEVGLRGGGDSGRGWWGSEKGPSPSPSVFPGSKWSESLSPSPPQASHLCPATFPLLTGAAGTRAGAELQYRGHQGGSTTPLLPAPGHTHKAIYKVGTEGVGDVTAGSGGWRRCPLPSPLTGQRETLPHHCQQPARPLGAPSALTD